MTQTLSAVALPTETLYALLFDEAGNVWNGSALVTWTEADWASYALTLTQQGTASGIFTGSLPAGLSTQSSYRYLVYSRLTGTPTEGDPLSGVGVTSVVLPDIYFADVHCARDPRSATPRDEYTLVWFKNGLPVVAGISDATLSVVRRSDGDNLVAATALTAVGSSGAWKLDVTGAARQTPGDAVIAVATATIDGTSRTWRKVLGKDSA